MGKLESAICTIEEITGDPRVGLPEEVFVLISKLTPLVNVDLLIQNDRGQTLLTWRAHPLYAPPGWHVPGGILRFKETAAQRIRAVARQELGADVEFDAAPLSVHETIQHQPERTIRGHFVSFLYRCTLLSPPAPALECTGPAPLANEWKWHDGCPTDLLELHEVYRAFIGTS